MFNLNTNKVYLKLWRLQHIWILNSEKTLTLATPNLVFTIEKIPYKNLIPIVQLVCCISDLDNNIWVANFREDILSNEKVIHRFSSYGSYNSYILAVPTNDRLLGDVCKITDWYLKNWGTSSRIYRQTGMAKSTKFVTLINYIYIL